MILVNVENANIIIHEKNMTSQQQINNFIELNNKDNGNNFSYNPPDYFDTNSHCQKFWDKWLLNINYFTKLLNVNLDYFQYDSHKLNPPH